MECILKIGVHEATIFTDSRSVVDIIFTSRINRNGNYLVFVLKNKLRSAFQQGIEVIISWIPAHVSILGNETADLLVKNAIGEGELSEYLHSHSDFFGSFRKRYINLTKEFFNPAGGIQGLTTLVAILLSHLTHGFLTLL